MKELTCKECVNSLIKKSKLTKTSIAHQMGFKTKASVTNRLNRDKDFKTDKFLRILDILGYEVVVRKKGKYRSICKIKGSESYAEYRD